jgi:hypothetical protein
LDRSCFWNVAYYISISRTVNFYKGSVQTSSKHCTTVWHHLVLQIGAIVSEEAVTLKLSVPWDWKHHVATECLYLYWELLV